MQKATELSVTHPDDKQKVLDQIDQILAAEKGTDPEDIRQALIWLVDAGYLCGLADCKNIVIHRLFNPQA